jgi:O-antigen chain-terminating methyltransferase
MRKASADAPPTKPVTGPEGIETGNYRSVYVPAADITPLNFQPPFTPQDEYRVEDLVQFSDEQFVENAYRAVLRRSADPVGLSGFVSGLRSGRLNKIDVLARLRYSKEGREQNVPVHGLFVPASLRTLYRVPILGYLLNLSVAVVRLPSIVKSNRQFEAHMLAHEEIFVRHVNHIGQTLVDQAGAFAAAEQRLLQHTNEQTAQVISEQKKTHEVILGRIAEFTQYVQERINEESAERREELIRLTNELRIVTRQAEESRTQIRAEVSDSLKSVLERMEQFQKRERLTSAELALQSQQLRKLVDSQSWQTAPHKSSDTDNHLLDAFFADFDELYRGAREVIKVRLKVYLPFLASAGDGRILDIGCGRGEWLELLRDNGLEATGVELNTTLVSACHARGLTVVEQDLLEYLSRSPDASVQAVTAFHVVEHLPIDTVVSFLDQALRVLTPGGVLILETPNPRNVLVGSCNFYLDPTHRNPFPSEALQLLVETRGFERIDVLPLNPSDAEPVPGDSELVHRFNQYFYGPMDYGLVAHKP